ncbi:hypothetical protein DSM106972_012580 [Dulcicalothrix desertica PCC 7102]|uniref:Uncharacterized protein n=1 Tax=Dulcicalothrix desertica PCC 7102 TaxID=232991 RepID=A0A3S1CV69_9CYAN|nr:hypothetical protein [Dulcicalothrix desertica]RUT09205.1 hypothetical protein DSM106972_012580 [Dulcicalothrix desertica PCC 7102]TWH55042.1 hypothetical protein CAL7102_03144 [Dulcicalothrix desertica PCC 7102]
MKIRLLALLSLAGLGLASVAQPSNAQTFPGNQTNPQNYDAPSDPFSRGTEQSPFNMFQMIHNAQLGINNYNPDFFNQQSKELDEAAAAFRARQQQMMQNGNTQNTGNIVQPLPQQGSQIIKLEPSK